MTFIFSQPNGQAAPVSGNIQPVQENLDPTIQTVRLLRRQISALNIVEAPALVQQTRAIEVGIINLQAGFAAQVQALQEQIAAQVQAAFEAANANHARFQALERENGALRQEIGVLKERVTYLERENALNAVKTSWLESCQDIGSPTRNRWY